MHAAASQEGGEITASWRKRSADRTALAE